jgi:hypothetical protein
MKQADVVHLQQHQRRQQSSDSGSHGEGSATQGSNATTFRWWLCVIKSRLAACNRLMWCTCSSSSSSRAATVAVRGQQQ